MISRPTLSCIYWLELIYTKCYHDVIMHVPPIGSRTQHHFSHFGFVSDTDFGLLMSYELSKTG